MRAKTMTDAEIKDIFLSNGFTIKPGYDDLKPYVYEAARALLARVEANARRAIDDLEIAVYSPEKSAVSVHHACNHVRQVFSAYVQGQCGARPDDAEN